MEFRSMIYRERNHDFVGRVVAGEAVAGQVDGPHTQLIAVAEAQRRQRPGGDRHRYLEIEEARGRDNRILLLWRQRHRVGRKRDRETPALPTAIGLVNIDRVDVYRICPRILRQDRLHETFIVLLQDDIALTIALETKGALALVQRKPRLVGKDGLLSARKTADIDSVSADKIFGKEHGAPAGRPIVFMRLGRPDAGHQLIGLPGADQGEAAGADDGGNCFGC